MAPNSNESLAYISHMDNSPSAIPFIDLPSDVLLEAIVYLNAKEVLRLQRTCKTLRVLAGTHAVWYGVIRHHLLPYGVSPPLLKGRRLADLSAEELKAAAVYSARLDYSWHNPSWARSFSSIDWQPEVPYQSVPMASFLPGTAGRYLMTITRNCLIRIWELEPNVRRHRMKYEWAVDGVVLDVAMNSDPLNEATFAISHVLHRDEYVTLYNFKTGQQFEHTVVHRSPLVGRLKILRGDLVVAYKPSRSRVHIVNYRTGSIGWLPSEKRLHGTSGATCHAVEVLQDCVVVVQLWGVDVFDLPRALTMAHPPKDPDGNPIIAVGAMIASRAKTDPERWKAAAIIPYTAPYPHIPPQRRTSHSDNDGHTRTISVLLRERVSSGEDVIHHEHIQLADDPELFQHYNADGAPLSGAPLTLLPSDWDPAQRRTDAILHDFGALAVRFAHVQTRHKVRAHFFSEIVAAPASGRGFWVENNTSAADRQSNERLMLFSASGSRTGREGFVDIGGRDAKGAECGEGTVRWCLQHMPAAMRSTSYCSLDDSVGRIVIATHDGKVRVVDLGSAAVLS